MKQKKQKKWVFIVIICVFSVVFLFSAYMLISIFSEYQQGSGTYETAQKEYIVEPSVQETTTPYQVDFSGLIQNSGESKAWIILEDSVINYPVMQAKDNSYYLTHLFDGTKNKSGSIFIDYRNSPDFADQNTILYGHHMKDGSMFASLVEYKHQDYYEIHQNMYLLTPTVDYRVEIFSAYVDTVDSDGYKMSFDNDKEYLSFLKNLHKKSEFNCDVEFSPEDRIITMSTCTYEFDNARFLVHGKLIPIAYLQDTEQN